MKSSPRRRGGFTMLELMIAIAVIAILATLAIPSYMGTLIRGQVTDGRTVAQFVQEAVAARYKATQKLPADNAAALVPPADRIVGHNVSAVEVRDGAVTITFGNQANRALTGRKLTLRAAVVDEYSQVKIAWVCAAAPVPAKMNVHGSDATDVPAAYLPVDCRGAAATSPGK